MSVRSVARLVSANSPSITQPVSSATVPRVAVAAALVPRRRSHARRVDSSIAIAKPGRPGSRDSSARRPVARITRPPSIARRSSARPREHRAGSPARRAESADARRAWRASPRADGRTARPTGTPSRTRGSRGTASMCVATSRSPAASVPSSNARMSTMRPRGLSFSSSSVRYVGHAWRQKPQCTHASMPRARVRQRTVREARTRVARRRACSRAALREFRDSACCSDRTFA